MRRRRAVTETARRTCDEHNRCLAEVGALVVQRLVRSELDEGEVEQRRGDAEIPGAAGEVSQDVFSLGRKTGGEIPVQGGGEGRTRFGQERQGLRVCLAGDGVAGFLGDGLEFVDGVDDLWKSAGVDDFAYGAAEQARDDARSGDECPFLPQGANDVPADREINARDV